MPSVDVPQSAEDQIPNPEVKTRRRKLTREYKLRILKEAEKLKGKSGAIGELLRREGIYSAALVTWRKQRDEGILAPTRGRKPADPLVREMLVLKKQNDHLIEKNRQYRLVIEAQKKMSEILGIRQDKVPPMPEEDGEE
jgi:transposase-like protein